MIAFFWFPVLLLTIAAWASALFVGILLGLRWGHHWALSALTVVIWGPLAPLALWTGGTR